MKKYLFLSAIAALGLMTSCSEENEILEANGTYNNSVVFITAPKGCTRSAETITSIDKFTVSGITADGSEYFTDTEFTYDNSKSVFTSNTPYYWPTTGTLSFYAISDPGMKTLAEGNVPQYSYTNWAGEKDLVSATVLAGQKTIPYKLTFQHLLSQVSISAEAVDKTEALTYKLTSVEMTAPCDGRYNFATSTGGTGTWAITNGLFRTYSFDAACPLTFAQNGSVTSGSTYWNILPVTDGVIKFKISYQVFKNGQLIADFTGENAKTCDIQNPSLQSGKRYVYNFLLNRGTDSVITFTTTIKGWTNGGTSNESPVVPLKSFTISPTDCWMNVGDTRQAQVTSFTPTSAECSVAWSSDNESVATINASTGLITAVASGVANIKATASNGLVKTCKVRVASYETDANGYQYVDVGIPNGTKWAAMNIGATSITDNGLYFQWGDKVGYKPSQKHTFTNSGYTAPSAITDENDVAKIYMGSEWRMPTSGDLGTLKMHTNYYYTAINGKNGWVFESKTDPSKFVFLPFSGAIAGQELVNDNLQGLYYTSTRVYYIALLDKSAAVQTTSGWQGYTVRAVRN